MKKIFSLIIAVAAVAMFTACDKETDSPYKAPETTIEVSSTDVVFGPAGGQGSISYTSQGAVTVSSDKDWCSVSTGSSVINVTVSQWEGKETRYALVTLKDGNYSVNVTVQQNGVQIGLSGDSKIISSAAQTFSVDLKSNVDLDIKLYEVDSEGEVLGTPDWITATYEDGKIVFEATQNTTGALRGAFVDATYMEEEYSVSVVQLMALTRVTDWKLSYGGRFEYYGSYGTEKVVNTVADASADKLYYFTYVSREDYNKAGLSLSEYVSTKAIPEAAASLEELYEYYGGQYEIADFLYSGSAEEWYIDNFSGQYYFFAIGFDEEGNPTGEYQYASVTITLPAYEYFLGEWNLTDASGYKYTLQVFPNVFGTSYKIRGPFSNFPVNAIYNADGTMLIQGSSTTAIATNYETTTRTYDNLYMIGGGLLGGTVYSITGATLRLGWTTRISNTAAVINGGSIVISNNVYNYVRLMLRGVSGGKNYTLDYVDLPATLAKGNFAVTSAPALVPAQKMFENYVTLPKQPYGFWKK